MLNVGAEPGLTCVLVKFKETQNSNRKNKANNSSQSQEWVEVIGKNKIPFNSTQSRLRRKYEKKYGNENKKINHVANNLTPKKISPQIISANLEKINIKSVSNSSEERLKIFDYDENKIVENYDAILENAANEFITISQIDEMITFLTALSPFLHNYLEGLYKKEENPKLKKFQLLQILQIEYIKNAILHESNPTEEMKKLFYPRSDLVLFYIIKFLSQQTDLNEGDSEFLKLIQDFFSTFFMIFGPFISFDFKNPGISEKEIIQNEAIKSYLSKRITNLEKQEALLLPGGWLSCSYDYQITGHFMLYLLKKEDEMTYTKIRINPQLYPGQTGVPQLVEEETLSSEQIKIFISDLVDLFFPFKIKEKVNSIEKSQQIKTLYETCREYSRIKIQLPYPFKFSNSHSYNCCFKSCLLLYFHLLEKKDESPKNLLNAKKAATHFEKQFLEYLTHESSSIKEKYL